MEIFVHKLEVKSLILFSFVGYVSERLMCKTLPIFQHQVTKIFIIKQVNKKGGKENRRDKGKKE